MKPYIDNIERRTDGTVYHVWVCKDEVFKFKPGDSAAIKSATERLIEKELITVDDLY